MRTGELKLIGVPIGNFQDISHRGLKALEECEAVLCEDTRESEYFLRYYNMEKKLLSYGGMLARKSINEGLRILKEGKNVCLVSDRGMPCISDPGAKIIEEYRKEKIKIECIPGPSAVTTAFTLSGYSGGFIFHGFLPRKEQEILKIGRKLAESGYHIIFFESAVRLKKTLEILNEIFKEQEITLAKDLTKSTEKIQQAKISDLLEKSDFKGEYVIIIKN